MKKIAMVFIGIGLASLPFALPSYAEEKLNAAGEAGSPKPREATKAGETDMTNTKSQPGAVPSKYTIMPVARGKKVEVASEMIGDTGRNSKGEDAMISIGDTGQLKGLSLELLQS
jgi:hypothetical protein